MGLLRKWRLENKSFPPFWPKWRLEPNGVWLLELFFWLAIVQLNGHVEADTLIDVRVIRVEAEFNLIVPSMSPQSHPVKFQAYQDFLHLFLGTVANEVMTISHISFICVYTEMNINKCFKILNLMSRLSFFSFFRSFVESLRSAAVDSKKDSGPYKSPRTPFVTNNSHYDHDDDRLTVWPGRHGGPSLGAFLSHG